MKPNKSPKREEKDGQITKLKNRIRNLEKENNKLKSDLKSYDKAFIKTTKFLKDNTKDISLEQLIKGANEDKTLKEVQKENCCEKCMGVDLYITKIPNGTFTLCRTCSQTKLEYNKDVDI